MTDKEILEAVKAEIERLHEEHRGSKGNWYYRLALRSILHFIKTLQVEPAKASVDEANKGKTSEQILAEMRGEEPVSEDLEEAVNDYTRKVLERTNCLIGNQFVGEEISKAVKFGANWQKEQMLKKSFGATVCKYLNTYFKEIDKDAIRQALRKYTNGDRVRVLIIKQE